MSQFLTLDSEGNWNTVPAVPPDALRQVNCHKYVLYTIGEIPWEEMVSDSQAQKEKGLDFTYGERLRALSDSLFTPVENREALRSLASQRCKQGNACIGEIWDTNDHELIHSFILERTKDDEYVISHKQGFKYPFAVATLESLLEFVNKDGEREYEAQEWRFIPIETVKF